VGGIKKSNLFLQGFVWGMALAVSSGAFASDSGGTIYGSLGSDANPAWSSNGNVFSVTAEQTEYGTQGSLPEQNEQYLNFMPYIKYKHESTNWVFGSEATAVLPGSDGVAFQFAVPELYEKFQLPGRLSVTVGRMRENWSLLDEQFHLGIWQPMARWDFLQPISQGLTGAFVTYHPADLSFLKLTLFGSVVYLPDQGPEFSLSHGQFVSSNRWFSPVVDEVYATNSPSSINYSLDTPSYSSIINHNSLAFMAEAGGEVGAFAKASFARLPVNQFLLAGIPTQIAGDSSVNVTVVPMVIDHDLITVEGGFRYEQGQILLSDTWEHFDNPGLPQNYQETALVDSQYLGAVVTNDLSSLHLHRANIGLGYVQRIEGTSPSSDTLIQGSIDSSSQRLAFERLVSWSFSKNVYKTYASSLDTNLGYYYSIDDEGEWLHASVAFNYHRQWTWTLAGDILGADGPLDSNSSFMLKYRGNDRVMGGLSYVF